MNFVNISNRTSKVIILVLGIVGLVLSVLALVTIGPILSFAISHSKSSFPVILLERWSIAVVTGFLMSLGSTIMAVKAGVMRRVAITALSLSVLVFGMGFLIVVCFFPTP